MKRKLMGILNVTPDSFYDGGKHFFIDAAIARGIQMHKEGADVIDIGGESTRPDADPVDEQEELQRVLPVIRGLKSELSIPLSIDTMKPKVAEAALKEGVSFINDVSGFSNPEMIALAASSGSFIFVMHMLGTPKTMQKDPAYPQGVIKTLMDWFSSRVEHLMKAGVKKENIFLDPGIGFGKTVDHNLQILQNLRELKTLGFPLLVGLSRKSFMRKILNKTINEILPATLCMDTVALLNGADIIRVHDVPEHRQLIDMLERYFECEKSVS